MPLGFYFTVKEIQKGMLFHLLAASFCCHCAIGSTEIAGIVHLHS